MIILVKGYDEWDLDISTKDGKVRIKAVKLENGNYYIENKSTDNTDLDLYLEIPNELAERIGKFLLGDLD